MPEITGLLLAAGRSRRFGRDKLQVDIAGRALILRSAACLRACDRLLAVVRPEHGTLHQTLRTAGIEIVVNERSHQGMGTSLACGVRASLESDGWCILPADMPCIEPATGERIVQALQQGASIAAPYYRGRRGHPVGFERRYGERLSMLEGDQGAREMLAGEPQALCRIPVEDAGILHDIDTPQDLGNIRR